MSLITYDDIGNPLQYRNGFTFSWVNGRRLSTVNKEGLSVSYTYNADGLRLTKTVNGVVTTYHWLEGTLLGQTCGNDTILFLYDENGSAYGFIHNDAEQNTSKRYYYIFNLQGDVIGILDSTGNQVVSYEYDVWGDVLSTTGTLANTVGQINPIRYRGYYYDAETEFYYLRSRYYDPVTQRFLNADSVVAGTGESVQGYNLFSYCFNNPVNLEDETGNWPKWLKQVAKVVKNTVKKAVKKFIKGVAEDLKNFDINNTSEQAVLDSNYISAYKGVPVIRTNTDRSASFGAIFLQKSKPNEDLVKHEYGHAVQLQELGLIDYTLNIAIPSALSDPYNPDYYNTPWEITADYYGGVSRQHSDKDLQMGFFYLSFSNRCYGFSTNLMPIF